MDDRNRLMKAKIPCRETGIQIKRTICDICAPNFHCGIDAYVKDGKVIKVEGTKEHPMNHGLLYTKGAANREYIYRKDRLMTPLRRVGERGEGRFEPISWETAYREIQEQFNAIKEKDGADAVAFFAGYSKWFRPLLKRLAFSFGSSNYGTESSCCWHASDVAWETMANGFAVPDMGRTNTYLGWGYNPYYSNHLGIRGMEAYKARGGKLIIVDVKKTLAAKKFADIFIQVKPGTDGALALGMAKIMIDNGWTDKEYIEKHTHGYEAFAEYVKEFNLEKVERITGADPKMVYEAAKLFATNGPASIHQSASPITQHKNGLQNYRAMNALLGLTGNFDCPGGNFPIMPFSFVYQISGFKTREAQYYEDVRPERTRPLVGELTYPLWGKCVDEMQAIDLSRQILEGSPYPIKGLFGQGMNILMFPDTDLLCEALKKLDFFVAVDLFETPTTRYADIVLPACSSFERSECRVYGGGYAYMTEPVIEPLGESRSDVVILKELAGYLAPQDELLCQGYEAFVDYAFADLSVSVADMKASDLPIHVQEARPPVIGETRIHGCHTPSGKFEFDSELIKSIPKEFGLDSLPTYREEFEDIRAGREFILSTGVRIPNAIHSRLHDVPWLRGLRPNPMADINDEDAARLGIGQGDDIRIETVRSSVQVKANVTSTVMKGTVHLYHGYKEANANALLPANWTDPYSGYPAYKSIGCNIVKC